MNKTSLAACARHFVDAACLVGSVALTSAPALAHGGHDVAAMDHARHGAMAAVAGSADYKRSQRTYEAIPDVVLVDADARPVRLRALLADSGPVMLNFIFTTCTTICPVMSAVFADVRARLGDESGNLRMVSISIDPENDTPAQLGAYAKKFGGDAHWTLLTGRAQDVAAVQRAFDSYDSDKMNHRPLTLLRAAPGRQWVRIDGFATADQLAGEYRSAMTP